MEQIQILTGITKNMISVVLPNDNNNHEAQAFLLSNTGEHLQKFLLQPGNNDLRLQKQKPGMYLLRIETNNEVAVKQIFIT